MYVQTIVERYVDERGRLHNEGGPAVVWADGVMWWCFHGKLHREDGPAITYADGSMSWYLDDMTYSEEEHARMVQLKVFW